MDQSKAHTTITAQKVQKFTWKNIICRYGLPQAIVMDNGRQFTEKDYGEFLKQLDIKHLTSLIGHPQTNRQAKVVNMVILTELCKRLSKVAKGLWVDKLPRVLWGTTVLPNLPHKKLHLS